MNLKLRTLLARSGGYALLLALTLAPVQAEIFALKFERLNGALAMLSSTDRQTVDNAIALIKRGDHNLALIELNSVSKSNPTSAGVRVLSAYALLNLGNTLGAFQEAKTAESVGHDSYICSFLGRVAYLVGDVRACKREIKHVRAAGDPDGEAAALEREIASKRR
ncbi:MAG: hypothetical protein NTV70_24065 [Acidobacteria bacterium]|nr:hypothetical protein [Acidobacteriota bacterium]